MTDSSGPLLLVEDSDEDYDAALWALRRLAFDRPVLRSSTGDDALDLLYRRKHYNEAVRPALIVLDLNLPGTDGRDVLSLVKSDEILRSIPIVVFSTSSNPHDVEQCYRAGANTYLTKPVDFGRFRELWREIVAYWFDAAILPSEA